ncbi:DUF4344 domain-containing metallopeptidase [Streptomyces monticola]|uniref:DUF4344 domain-containing metallopeptidase n=1 Tax=Streptomyces monticola TaxID=2666263 RepID=A0ABW2JDZ8_9ACTN
MPDAVRLARAVAATALTLAAASACSSGGAASSPAATPPAREPAARFAPTDPASTGASPGDGRLEAVYEPGMTKANQREEATLSKNKVLEGIAKYGNDRIRLPYVVGVTAANCGGDGDASWRSFQHEIQFCYEFAESARKIYEKADGRGDGQGKKPSAAQVDDSVAGFTNGIVFHELGHALIDMYDLPATGKEEDAVDQLSVLLLATGDDQHARYALDTSKAWGGFAQADEADGSASKRLEAYAAEHSLNAQRHFNWACWLYGSNPRAHAELVRDKDRPGGALPESRAGSCANEFNRIKKAWTTLLKPYVK